MRGSKPRRNLAPEFEQSVRGVTLDFHKEKLYEKMLFTFGGSLVTDSSETEIACEGQSLENSLKSRNSISFQDSLI